MKWRFAAGAAVALSLAAWFGAARTQEAHPTAPSSAGTETGFAVFQTRCMGCHGNRTGSRTP